MVRKPPASPYRIGRVQRGIRFAFWAHRTQVLRTSDFMPWCFPAQPAGSYRAAQRWNARARRAAQRFAVVVDHRGSIDQFSVWRPTREVPGAICCLRRQSMPRILVVVSAPGRQRHRLTGKSAGLAARASRSAAAPDIILASGTPSIQALQEATRTVPRPPVDGVSPWL